jgi:hypothetical protein
MSENQVFSINSKTLMEAYEVFNQLADNFGNLPEEKASAAAAALHCRLASTYALEMAYHIQRGMEPYDALLTVARGDTSLDDVGVRDSLLTTINLLTRKAEKE